MSQEPRIEWEFEVLRFGKPVPDISGIVVFTLCEDKSEAILRAREFLYRGETLGRLLTKRILW